MSIPTVAAHLQGVPAHTRSGAHITLSDVTLTWAKPDPLRIELGITDHPSRKPTLWGFGRDLLADGLHNRAGLGDLTIAPSPERTDSIEILLRDSRGIGRNLALLLPRLPVARFLHETTQVVPLGAETVRVTDHTQRGFHDVLAGIAAAGMADEVTS
jgi:hypothetical protein